MRLKPKTEQEHIISVGENKIVCECILRWRTKVKTKHKGLKTNHLNIFPNSPLFYFYFCCCSYEHSCKRNLCKNGVVPENSREAGTTSFIIFIYV